MAGVVFLSFENQHTHTPHTRKYTRKEQGKEERRKRNSLEEETTSPALKLAGVGAAGATVHAQRERKGEGEEEKEEKKERRKRGERGRRKEREGRRSGRRSAEYK